MKRLMSVFVVFLLIFSLANVSFIIAQEEVEDSAGVEVEEIVEEVEEDEPVVEVGIIEVEDEVEIERIDELEDDLDDITEDDIDAELGDGGSVNGFDSLLMEFLMMI